MPARFNLKTQAPQEQLTLLGQQIRQHRKAHRLSAEAVAAAAGLSRTTLHRIEAGEPSVAAGAYWAAVAALGLRCGILSSAEAGTEGIEQRTRTDLPAQIELATYPQLKLLAWHVQGADFISPQQAWDIYQRNWRHIEEANIPLHEAQLIEQLRLHFKEPSKNV